MGSYSHNKQLNLIKYNLKISIYTGGIQWVILPLLDTVYTATGIMCRYTVYNIHACKDMVEQVGNLKLWLYIYYI